MGEEAVDEILAILSFGPASNGRGGCLAEFLDLFNGAGRRELNVLARIGGYDAGEQQPKRQHRDPLGDGYPDDQLPEKPILII